MQGAVRPVLIVVGLVVTQDPPQMGLIPDEGARSRSLRRQPPIHCSAIAFMRGVAALQSTVRIPACPRVEHGFAR
jgi:hypothetical protein